jgi:hypothetical protein
MDVLTLACIVLTLTNISFAILAARNWYRAEIAQREIAQLVAQQQPRGQGAGYETGLVEVSKVA